MNNVVIIAEAGVNHNGDVGLAKKLIDKAADCKVDYIKFQTFKTELIVDRSAPKAKYQSDAIGEKKSQFDMIKELELTIDNFVELKEYCSKRNIKFLTSVADLVSLDEIRKFNLDYIKISSGEVVNPLFLRAVSKLNVPVILSTGMSKLSEIETAISNLSSSKLKREEITLLHCNTEYPTPIQDVNLKAMHTLREAFKLPVGYSDHTLGIEVPIAAVAMGATVIEKHFTLDKNMKGPDHSSSLEPNEMADLVRAIRNIELAFGDGIKQPSPSEKKNIPVVRKSIFASKSINKGEIFSELNLMLKRPGDGMPASDIDDILGRIASRDISANEKLDYKAISW